jgi:hypothetical protein
MISVLNHRYNTLSMTILSNFMALKTQLDFHSA